MKNSKFETIKILSLKACNNPNKIYVFGDNLIKKGKKGQACIRDAKNAFGVPTKRLPCMQDGCFFSDQKDEYEAVEKALFELLSLESKYDIVVPEDGIGTGLAKMEEFSPKLFKYINKMLGYSE